MQFVFALFAMALLDGGAVHGRCSGCDGVPFQLGELRFLNEREGWSTAWFLPSGNGTGLSTMLHTTDGGRHWRRLPFVWQTSSESGPPFSFLDRNHGWVHSTSQEAVSFLYKTSNGGRSWTRFPSGYMEALQFVDLLNGYAISGSEFQRSTDGGKTWTHAPLPLPTVDVMSFADRSAGIIIGSSPVAEGQTRWDGLLRIVTTNDGGANWTEARMPEVPYGLTEVFIRADAKNAFVAIWGPNDTGSTLLQTSDGGRSWIRHSDASLQGPGKYIKAIAIAPNGRGYLFFENEKESFIASTTNGGTTWKAAKFDRRASSCTVFNGQIWCSSGMDILKFELP